MTATPMTVTVTIDPRDPAALLGCLAVAFALWVALAAAWGWIKRRVGKPDDGG